MICPLKPNNNWLNYPSPSLVPEVKWRRARRCFAFRASSRMLLSVVEWWRVSIFLGWAPHPGRGGGEGREQRAFDGSLRRETTLYLTQISAGQMGAQLSSEKQLPEKPREDSNASPKRSLGRRRLSPARKRQWRQIGGGWERRRESTLSPFSNSMWMSPLPTLSNI